MRTFAQRQNSPTEVRSRSAVGLGRDMSGWKYLQTKPVEGSHKEEIAIPAFVNKSVHSPGEPLDSSTRRFIEPRFGRDLSRVRVHADVAAAEAAAAISARAFTVDHDIVFGAGEYAPQTESGRRLLSHELTHVIQQQAGVHLKDGVGQAGDPYERHADAVADLVVNRRPAGPLLDAMPGGAKSHKANAAGAGVRGALYHPIQMQAAGKQAQPSEETGNPGLELLRDSFQKTLEKQRLNESMNGAWARALARAYVNRNGGPLDLDGRGDLDLLHATPYIADKVGLFSKEPSEDEVYCAILGALETQKMGKGGKATDWEWKPASVAKPETKNGAVGEILNYGADHFSDWKDLRDIKNIPRRTVKDFRVEHSAKKTAGKALSLGAQVLTGTDIEEITKEESKDLVVKYTAQWLANKRLIALAAIVTGTYEIYGAFQLLISTLELLTLLTRPTKREMSRSERIAVDVRNWLIDEQRSAEEARQREAESMEASDGLLGKSHTTGRDHTALSPRLPPWSGR
jgi:Domain of unknown function (DUF4157)